MYHWDQIYQNNVAKLIGISRRYVKNADLAEDLVHDAFETAMQKAQQFQGKGSIDAWLYRIVIHKSLDYLKSQQSSDAPEHVWNSLTDTPHDMNPTFTISQYEKVLQANLSQTDLLEAIDALPDHHRTVFNMHVIDGWGHQDIAQALQISVGTSKSHLFRARQKIQALLLARVEQQPVEEKKKKRRWLLLFWISLGWGDRLLAARFKHAFSRFSLAPRNPKVYAASPLVQRKRPIARMQAIGAILLGISMGCLLWIKLQVPQTVLPEDIAPPHYTPHGLNSTRHNSAAQSAVTRRAQQAPIVLRTNPSKEAVVSTPRRPMIGSSLGSQLPNEQAQDSNKAGTAVVIKKIKVKRDTVYVEQHP